MSLLSTTGRRDFLDESSFVKKNVAIAPITQPILTAKKNSAKDRFGLIFNSHGNELISYNIAPKAQPTLLPFTLSITVKF